MVYLHSFLAQVGIRLLALAHLTAEHGKPVVSLSLLYAHKMGKEINGFFLEITNENLRRREEMMTLPFLDVYLTTSIPIIHLSLFFLNDQSITHSDHRHFNFDCSTLHHQDHQFIFSDFLIPCSLVSTFRFGFIIYSYAT